MSHPTDAEGSREAAEAKNTPGDSERIAALEVRMVQLGESQVLLSDEIRKTLTALLDQYDRTPASRPKLTLIEDGSEIGTVVPDFEPAALRLVQ
ncbi:hypothetical protein E1281_01085 [Actinomadura sp. KC345]|uniref:hypothetical protein n=1 Tax=Actinomadura sp. KC345 TaxID=2530371 RepID=UPI001046D569|nr:hypothetical protein [Actinomadura sp. KC345]TDC58576.1 hypothetical protein E1281_01085 [Actinomadura sp. KC345]